MKRRKSGGRPHINKYHLHSPTQGSVPQVYNNLVDLTGPALLFTYSINTGASGILTVNVGATTYEYKLSDILGRIEVQQL